jgi:hypothetical protein
MRIRVIGPAELPRLRSREGFVDTTSKSEGLWTTELSPFHLGPVPLYDGRVSRTMENGWQYAKLYHLHQNEEGSPSEKYWKWAQAGWDNSRAVRYPMGKGAKPACCLWEGERLGYIDARLKVYWSLYQNAVVQTRGFERLCRLAETVGEVVLFDFDGYDHEARGMSLQDVMLNPSRPMGHAFVLKALLLHGARATPDDLLAEVSVGSAADKEQLVLF